MTIGDYTALLPIGYVPGGKAAFISRQPIWYLKDYSGEVFDDSNRDGVVAYPFGSTVQSALLVDAGYSPAGWSAPPTWTFNGSFIPAGGSIDDAATGTIRVFVTVAPPEPVYKPPDTYANSAADVYSASFDLTYTFFVDGIGQVFPQGTAPHVVRTHDRAKYGGNSAVQPPPVSEGQNLATYNPYYRDYSFDAVTSNYVNQLKFLIMDGSLPAYVGDFERLDLMVGGTAIATYYAQQHPQRPAAPSGASYSTGPQIAKFDWAIPGGTSV